MRRIGVLAAITLVLAMALYAQNQTPRTKSSGPQAGGATNQRAKVKGRVLVKKLPAGAGAVIKNGMVQLKPGYKFVKESGGKVSIYLDNAPTLGGSVGGTFTCTCLQSGPGGNGCSIVTSSSSQSIYCTKSDKNPCNGECTLTVTVNGSTQSVIAY